MTLVFLPTVPFESNLLINVPYLLGRVGDQAAGIGACNHVEVVPEKMAIFCPPL